MLSFYNFIKNFNWRLRFQLVIFIVFFVCCFQVELHGQLENDYLRDHEKFCGDVKKLKKEEYQKAIEFFRNEIICYTRELKFNPNNYKEDDNNTLNYVPNNKRYSYPMVIYIFSSLILALSKLSVDIINDPVEMANFRKYTTETWCIYYQSIESCIIHDEEYVKKLYKSVPPRYTSSGIVKSDPSIKNEKPVKKDIEKELLIKKYRHELGWHISMTKFKSEFHTKCNRSIYVLYSKLPADYKELEDILEKYKYPLEETVNIFVELKIPYKGFRQWKSTDGFFRSNAKFIEIKKDDVILELVNGKRTEIKLKSLCKADQAYIKDLKLSK
jgi:hypothetical protein